MLFAEFYWRALRQYAIVAGIDRMGTYMDSRQARDDLREAECRGGLRPGVVELHRHDVYRPVRSIAAIRSARHGAGWLTGRERAFGGSVVGSVLTARH